MQFGDVAFQLGLQPKLSVLDLLEAGARLDADLLRATTIEHPSGLKVIAAPPELMPLEGMPSEQLLAIVDLATREFGTVFVDLPTNWTNWSLSLVARSDLVLLVTELSVAACSRARRQLDLLQTQDLGQLDVRVVVNRLREERGPDDSSRGRARSARPRRRLHHRQRPCGDARGDRPRRSDRRNQAQVGARQGSRHAGRGRRRRLGLER